MAAAVGAVGTPRTRIGVLGSSKTVHRYAERLRRSGAETRAVEVLKFQPRAQAVAEAVALILDSQRVDPTEQQQGGSRTDGPRLQVIVTSSVAVEILHAALDATIAAECPRATYDPTRTAVLTINGCGTAHACAACPAFGNVAFRGKHLRDIYTHLESQPHLHRHVRTVILGVATGGDRSYRTSPTLSEWIEELGVYESAEVFGATVLVRQTLSWLGPEGGDLVVTSSKSATVLARAINAHCQSNATYPDYSRLRHLRIIAQGPSTAATLCRALGGEIAVEILTPASPNVDAIAELLGHDKRAGKQEPAKTPFKLNVNAEFAGKTEGSTDSSMLYTISIVGLVAMALLFSVQEGLLAYAVVDR